MTKINESLAIQIQTLNDAGFGYRKIANQLDLNASTVEKHLKKKRLLELLPPKEKTTKYQFSAHQKLAIKRYIAEFPICSLQQVISALELDCHKSTLCRYLQYQGIERRAAMRGPLLRPANVIKRLEFAKDMVTKSDDFVKSIFWTDEFTVQSWPNGEITFYWAPRDSNQRTDIVSARVQNGGVRVMFWASMTWYSYGPLIAIEGSQNQTTYKNLLLEQVLPEFAASNIDLVFQHDNAPCHTARSIQAFLAEQNMNVLDWPPQSPDLSPIEWMWNVIKMKLKALNPRPRTKNDIIDAVYKIWNEMDPEIGKKMCMTFKQRMVECINKNGHLTGF